MVYVRTRLRISTSYTMPQQLKIFPWNLSQKSCLNCKSPWLIPPQTPRNAFVQRSHGYVPLCGWIVGSPPQWLNGIFIYKYAVDTPTSLMAQLGGDLIIKLLVGGQILGSNPQNPPFLVLWDKPFFKYSMPCITNLNSNYNVMVAYRPVSTKAGGSTPACYNNYF